MLINVEANWRCSSSLRSFQKSEDDDEELDSDSSPEDEDGLEEEEGAYRDRAADTAAIFDL